LALFTSSFCPSSSNQLQIPIFDNSTWPASAFAQLPSTWLWIYYSQESQFPAYFGSAVKTSSISKIPNYMQRSVSFKLSSRTSIRCCECLLKFLFLYPCFTVWPVVALDSQSSARHSHGESSSFFPFDTYRAIACHSPHFFKLYPDPSHRATPSLRSRPTTYALLCVVTFDGACIPSPTFHPLLHLV
jgi:hypothetical protein